MESTITYQEIEIPIGNISLKGNLRLSTKNKGIILFSHGCGSSRLSSRNNYVADFLFNQGFSSLLFDLLTPQEDTIYENRFDIELLTNRLLKATLWISKNKSTKHLSIGYFGASTGAASALKAASILGKNIKAIVSRGGRADLAMPVLDRIEMPTLLIVGGNDHVVIELNKKAQNRIKGICELKIIQGATHLFEEPGALDKVSKETVNWFNMYLN
jgi:alpha-beta hydrolase superfamily lysophospholipase